MNNWKIKLLSLFAALAFVAGLASAQQFTYVNTTLSTALGYTASGNQNLVQLASVTGLTAQVTGIGAPGNGSVIYVDRELMQVNQINVAANTVVVTRGILGSQAAPHVSGSVVLGGYAWWFNDYDPEGACTAAQTVVLPWINTRTSAQWTCSTVTLQWVPGFGNPGQSGAQPNFSTAQTGATITPAGPLFSFTGTTALVTINLPVGAKDGTTITIQFNGSVAGLTWTAAGNISAAGTSTTAGSLVSFTYNLASNKWMPSRLA